MSFDRSTADGFRWEHENWTAGKAMLSILGPLLVFMFALSPLTADTVVDAVFNTATDVPVTGDPVDLTGQTVNLSLGFTPSTGTSLMVVRNTGLAITTGRFGNLAQGQEIGLVHDGIVYRFHADYFGGTGNDLVLHWLRSGVSAWGNNRSGEFGNGTYFSTGVEEVLPVKVPTLGAVAGKTLRSVSLGVNHGLGVCTDGTLVSWGSNGSGELGDGTFESNLDYVPREVLTTGFLSGKKVVSVSAGMNSSLALCADGTIAQWGNYNPTPQGFYDSGVLAGKQVVAISAGPSHNLALCSDGMVAAWGSNKYGQLGNGGGFNGFPVAVTTSGALAGKRVIAIEAGGRLQSDSDFPTPAFCLALCSDGSVVAWGTNLDGELGQDDDSSADEPVAVDITGALAGKQVLSIAAGGTFALAVCSDGTVVAWGSNKSGQLGNGSTISSRVPVLVDASGALSGKKAMRVTAGELSAYALCEDGSVISWGENGLGELGDGTTIDRPSPVLVVSSGALANEGAVELEAGWHTCMAISAITPGTELSGLTLSGAGLTREFSQENLSYFHQAVVGESTLSITPTAKDAARITLDGVALISGTAATVPIVAGTSTHIVRVSNATEFRDYTIKVQSGNAMEAEFRSSGEIAWEDFGGGMAGVAVHVSLEFNPNTGTSLTLVRNGGSDFANWRFSNLAHGQKIDLTYGGKTYPFVANYYGGSGNDLVLEWANRTIAVWGQDYGRTPALLANSGALTGKTVTAISAGYRFNLALCADGSIASWGFGTNGELGLGNVTSVNVPTVIDVGGRTVIAISAASQTSLALCSDGTLLAWGLGSFGQLGNGGGANSKNPVAVDRSGVLAGKSIISLAVGGLHCLAVCSDGTVAAWGDNQNGQLGDGTLNRRNAPVMVSMTGNLVGKKVAALSAGFQHSLALCGDGTLFGWGDNSKYQVTGGQAYPFYKTLPVKMNQTGALAGKSVVALSQAAHSSCLVLCSDGSLVGWGSYNSPESYAKKGALTGRSVKAISSGGESSFAICTDDSIVAWGANTYGQIGIDSVNYNAGYQPILVEDHGLFSGGKPLFGAMAYHTVMVMAVPLGGFPGWAFDEPGLADHSATGDPDLDGISNLMEFVLTGDPTISSPEILPVASADGADLVFGFERLATSADDTTQVFQTSPDMVNWTDIPLDPASPEVVLGTAGPDGKQDVTVTVPKGVGTSLFGRLRVARP